MGRKLVDLTGRRFHRLTVERFLARAGHSSRWLCRCDCGETCEVSGPPLQAGSTKSCGCLRAERMSTLTLKHGERGGQKRKQGSPEYKAWEGMRQRCGNPNDKDWPRYGGRGIKVCERWQSFENFLYDMGRRPSSVHSIDRYPNGDGDYEPSNCRWAVSTEQARNRSNNRSVGSQPTISSAAERAGIPLKTVKSRLSKGWSLDDALGTPVDEYKRSIAVRSARGPRRNKGKATRSR